MTSNEPSHNARAEVAAAEAELKAAQEKLAAVRARCEQDNIDCMSLDEQQVKEEPIIVEAVVVEEPLVVDAIVSEDPIEVKPVESIGENNSYPETSAACQSNSNSSAPAADYVGNATYVQSPQAPCQQGGQSASHQAYQQDGQSAAHQAYQQGGQSGTHQAYQQPPYQAYQSAPQSPNQQSSQQQSYQQPPQQQGYQQTQQQYYQPIAETKDHVAAGLLAIFLGAFGVHKFYLGYNVAGFIMLGVSIIGGILTFSLAAWVMGVIAFIEGIIYLIKKQYEFDQIYVFNKKEWF